MKTEGYYVNTGRWQSVNGKKDKNCGVRDGRGIAGDISSAVSYTHLDVYKRQSESCAFVALRHF